MYNMCFLFNFEELLDSSDKVYKGIMSTQNAVNNISDENFIVKTVSTYLKLGFESFQNRIFCSLAI